MLRPDAPFLVRSVRIALTIAAWSTILLIVYVGADPHGLDRWREHLGIVPIATLWVLAPLDALISAPGGLRRRILIAAAVVVGSFVGGLVYYIATLVWTGRSTRATM